MCCATGLKIGLASSLSNKNPPLARHTGGGKGESDYLKRSMYACEEPHKACTASLVQLVDAGIGEDLGEHLTDLILQDGVHIVSAEFRVTGKDVSGPLGMLLQLFGVLGCRCAGDQHISKLQPFPFSGG